MGSVHGAIEVDHRHAGRIEALHLLAGLNEHDSLYGGDLHTELLGNSPEILVGETGVTVGGISRRHGIQRETGHPQTIGRHRIAANLSGH